MKNEVLGKLINLPYSTAELVVSEDEHYFLMYATGQAAVILPYKKDNGKIWILLISEDRRIPHLPLEKHLSVVKTIGGFKGDSLENSNEFFSRLVSRESGYVVTEEGKNHFRIFGDFPDFEIAEFPIQEVLINAEYLVKEEDLPKSVGFWVSLEDAAKEVVKGHLDDAAAEVSILRLFTAIQTGLIEL